MNTRRFVESLGEFAIPGVFNPYSTVCTEHDCDDAPGIRRENLLLYLDSAIEHGVDSVWLGRDLGYRGGRRTGIALTDEFNLSRLEDHFGICGVSKATTGELVRERTATEIWNILIAVDAKVFLWNVFPFHPHMDGLPMSNRRHTAREFALCKDILLTVLECLRPTTIVALGRDAHKDLTRVGIEAMLVRHPSYGGHIEFARTIHDLYGGKRSSQAG